MQQFVAANLDTDALKHMPIPSPNVDFLNFKTICWAVHAGRSLAKSKG
jgi:hypothetical protein